MSKALREKAGRPSSNELFLTTEQFQAGLRLLYSAVQFETNRLCCMVWFVRPSDYEECKDTAIEYKEYNIHSISSYILRYKAVFFDEWGQYDYYVNDFVMGVPDSNKYTILRGRIVFYPESKNAISFFKRYWQKVMTDFYKILYNIDLYRQQDKETQKLISQLQPLQGDFNKDMEEFIL